MTLVSFLCLSLILAPVATAQPLKRVSAVEFENYIRWLRLDEDQQAIAREFYRKYEEPYDEEFLPKIREYYEKVGAPIEPGYHDAVRRHAEFVGEVQQERAARDEALLSDLDSILREDQKKWMQRVRLGRERVLWRAGRGELPEGNVDLVELLDSLELSDEEQKRVDQFLVEFEPRFVEALERSTRARRAAEEYYHKAAAIEHALESDGASRMNPTNEQARLFDEARRYRERSGRMKIGKARDLVGINREGLVAVGEVLSDENRSLLEEQYRRVAYPEIWPDPASAQMLYDLVLGFEDLTDDQRAVTETLQRRFAAEHARLSVDMAESTMRRRDERKQGTRDGTSHAVQEWQNLRKMIGPKREALNESQAALLKNVLTPEQFARLPEWNFEENPPERPWDPWAERDRERQKRREARQREIERRQRGGG